MRVLSNKALVHDGVGGGGGGGGGGGTITTSSGDFYGTNKFNHFQNSTRYPEC